MACATGKTVLPLFPQATFLAPETDGTRLRQFRGRREFQDQGNHEQKQVKRDAAPTRSDRAPTTTPCGIRLPRVHARIRRIIPTLRATLSVKADVRKPLIKLCVPGRAHPCILYVHHTKRGQFHKAPGKLSTQVGIARRDQGTQGRPETQALPLALR